MSVRIIVLAGAAGDLGARILAALVARGAEVRALVRPGTSSSDRDMLRARGATITPADPADVEALSAACDGADCVVSALNGLHAVIVDRQRCLLAAAVRAGVPRFIPSDFAADFTKTEPGLNRNFDLRREFMTCAESAPLAMTSILNGAFMDMLGGEMPIIQPRLHRVLHWGDVDQPLDFTMKDDVAAYTADVALDSATPRFLRIAGDTVSARQLATAMTQVTGRRHATLRIGGIAALGAVIRVAKLVAPQPEAVFPPWQGMQYMRDMFSGRARLVPLDTGRYPDVRWTSVTEHLARRFGPRA